MQNRHLPPLLRFIPQFALICIIFALSKFEANPFFRPVVEEPNFLSSLSLSERTVFKNTQFSKMYLYRRRKITQLVLAIQCRHKKQCTNCQDHEEMKLLLKQKLKEQLQRTRQTERNKESRTLGLEAIGKLCRHGRIIYYSSK